MAEEATDIQDALANVPAGAEVQVKMKDGTELTATVRREGEDVALDGDDATELDSDQVAEVTLEDTTEGPE